MTQITDVSPTASNTSTPSINHSVIGRMLSIACSPDGQALYTGSYSNLWSSTDGGRNFDQLTWPQPAPNLFDAPGSLGGWCVADIAVSLGWRVEERSAIACEADTAGVERHRRIWRVRSVDGAEQWRGEFSTCACGAEHLWVAGGGMAGG